MELTHTDRNHGGFDLQDMALLVSFYDQVQEDGTVIDCTTEDADEGTIEGDTNKGKTNNGHGNNMDGVDSSNPGNSKAGEDTDPDVDDEKQRGRRKK